MGETITPELDRGDRVTNTSLNFPRVNLMALAEAILTVNCTASNPNPGGTTNNGTDTPGRNEKDTMLGGTGRDLFVLGNRDRVFYDDISYRTPGTSDYARITDFNPTQDLIQLHGSASDYSLGTSPLASVSGTALYYTKNQQRPELIAILQGPNPPTTLTTGFKYI